MLLADVASAAMTTVFDEDFSSGTTPAGFSDFGTPSYSGGQLVLDGSSAIYDTSSPLTATDEFVIEAIVTASSFDGFDFVLANSAGAANSGYGVLAQGGNWQGIHMGQALFGPSANGTGTAYALALVRTGGVSQLYANGTPIAGTRAAAPAAPTQLNIGYNPWDGAIGAFNGQVDRVRLSTITGAFNAGDLLGPGDGTIPVIVTTCQLTFTNLSGRATLTNFPVMVKLGSHIAGFDYGSFLSVDGHDLRFWTNSLRTGAEVKYEIEEWDTGGTSYVWVQVPALAHDDSIWASWGDPTYSSQETYTTNGDVWSADFDAVFHLNETVTDEQTTGVYDDSSPNDNDGAQTRTGVGTGVIAQCASFDGNGDFIRVANESDYDFIDTITASAWVQVDTWNSIYQMFITKGVDAAGWDVRRVNNEETISLCLQNQNKRGGATSVGNGQWHHIAATYRQSPVDARVYIDGQLYFVDPSPPATVGQNNDPLQISGRDTNNNNWLKHRGLIDEVRVSQTYRSADWIWACWMNQGSNHDAFMEYGAAEAPGQPTLASATVTNITTTSALGGVVLGGEDAYVTLYWGTNDAGQTFGWEATNSTLAGSLQSTGAIDAVALSSLDGDRQYYYIFYASNNLSGLDAWSAADQSFDTPLTGKSVADLAAAANSATEIGLTWTDNFHSETGYVIQRSPNGMPPWTTLTTTGAGAASYDDGGLSEGTTYHYRIAATNGAGLSDWSTAAQATTPVRPRQIGTDFTEATFEDIGILTDIPNPGLASITLDDPGDRLVFTTTGNTDMWGARNNAPIAYIMRPSASSWYMEAELELAHASQQQFLMVVYTDTDGAKPVWSFGFDHWGANDERAALQRLGGGTPSEFSADFDLHRFTIRMEVEEDTPVAGTARYTMKYDIGAGMVTFYTYDSNVDNARVGLAFKNGNAGRTGYVYNLEIASFPSVDITNANDTVGNAVTTYDIGGTNSADAVGNLSWTNSLTGASGSLAAGTPNWVINGIALDEGDNVIPVTGTNAYGVAASDSVTITRLTSGTVVAGDLIQDLDAEAGVTTSGPDVTAWANQAASGGDDVATDIGAPQLLLDATPSDRKAIAFSNDRMHGDDVDAFDALVTGGGHTWFVVAKVNAQDGDSPPNRFFGTLYDGQHFHGIAPGIQTDGKVYADTRATINSYDAGQTVGTTDLNDGNYHIIAGRLAAGTGVNAVLQELFVDSASADASNNRTVTTDNTGPLNFSGDPLTVGTERWGDRVGGGIEHCDADIARILIYDRPLSDVEVAHNVSVLNAAYLVPLPFVDVTNGNDIVASIVPSIDIGGTNNTATVGTMTWTNSLTGANGTLSPGTPNWLISSVVLDIGVNVITVTGTNSVGVESSDSVTITKQAATSPYVNVTNVNETVFNAVATTSIGGTNNANVVGTMVWTNEFTGADGTLSPGSPDWVVNGIGLDVGVNVITVTGTNASGVAHSDSVTITRLGAELAGSGTGITGHATVDDGSHGTPHANAGVSGNVNDGDTGTRVDTWNGGNGDVFDWAGVTWGSGQGINQVHFYGASFDDGGWFASDTTRSFAALEAPDVQVTTDGTTWTDVSGVSDDYVSVLTSDTFIGGGQLHSRVTFSFPAVYGVTGVRLLGNGGGDVSGGPGFIGVWEMEVYEAPPAAFVDVTNANITVATAVDTYTIGGTNNAYTVGTLSWTNSLTGASGSLSVGTPTWQISGIALAEGDNVITVTGANASGSEASDSVTITRLFDRQILALYTFEGSSPAAFDDVSGQGLDPTSIGAAGLDASGHEDQAASFGGSGNGVGIPINISPAANGTLTIGAWVKPDVTGQRGVFGHDDSGWDRGLNVGGLSGGTNWEYPGGSDWDSGIPVNVGAWQFVAVAYNGQDAKIYVDTSTDTQTQTAGGGNGTLGIGGYNASGLWPYDGLVDNFFIFDEVLSDEDVETIRLNGLAGIHYVAGLAWVDVTNGNDSVAHGTLTANIGGTNNLNVVGTMSWTNSLTGMDGTVSAGSTWLISGVGLDVGDNVITVTGTNATGVAHSDSVTIFREAASQPYVYVTNANDTVVYAVNSYDIGGSNNVDVVGLMSWTNSLTGGTGTVSPGSPSWQINGIALDVGTNVITVTGTNAIGVAASDSVTITRDPLPAAGTVTLYSLTTGNWNTPGTWEWGVGGGAGNLQPPTSVHRTVVLDDTVTVAANGAAYSLEITNASGSVVINPGIDLTIDQGVEIDQGAMTVSGTLSATDVTLSSGSLTASDGGVITASGALMLRGGTINSSGNVDITGGAPTISGTSLNITGGHLTLPEVTTLALPGGNVLWLDANDIQGDGTPTVNGAPVTVWADKSGSGVNASNRGDPTAVVFSDGTINNLAAIRMDGDDSIPTDTTIDAGVRPDVTIFVVYDYRSVAGDDCLWGQENGGWDRFALMNHGVGPGVTHGNGMHAVAAMGTAGIGFVINEVQMAENVGSGSHVMINSVQQGGSFTMASSAGGPANAFAIGAQNAGTAAWSTPMDVAEVLVFDRVLTSGERDNVGGYLANRYGISAPNYAGILAASVTFDDVTMAAAAQLTIDDGGGGVGEATVSGTLTAGDGATINADVIAAGTVAPGSSVGTLNIAGDYTQAAGSTCNWEVAGNALGQADRIHASGSVDATGAWTLKIIPTGPSVNMNGAVIMTGDSGATVGTPTIIVAGPFSGNYDITGASVSSDGNNITISGVVQSITTANAGGVWSNAGTWDGGVPTVDLVAFVAGGTVTHSVPGGVADGLTLSGGNLSLSAGGTIAVDASVGIDSNSVLTVDGVGTELTAGGSVTVYGGGQLHLSNGGVATGATVEVQSDATLKTSGDMPLPDYISLDTNSTLHVASGTLSVSSGDMPTGCILWLDANDIQGDGTPTSDGAPVTAWADKSGSGVNASNGGDPTAVVFSDGTINNRAAVRLDGNDWIPTDTTIDAAVRPDVTIFVVYDYRSVAGDDCLWGQENGGWDRFALMNHGVGPGVTHGGGMFGVPAMGNAGIGFVINEVQMAEGVGSGSHVMINGVQQGANFTMAGSAGGPANAFSIGSQQAGGGTWATPMDVAEVLVFDRVLTSEERNKVGGYLAGKYGIASSYTGGFAQDFCNLHVDSGATVRNTGIAVAGFGEITGAGTITSDVSVDSLLAPGSGIATLTVDGDVMFETGASLAIDFNVSPSPTNDKLVVSGDLDVSEATLNFQAVGSMTGRTRVIAEYGGTVSGPFAGTSIPAGSRIDYDFGGGKVIAVIKDAPPTLFIVR